VFVLLYICVEIDAIRPLRFYQIIQNSTMKNAPFGILTAALFQSFLALFFLILSSCNQEAPPDIVTGDQATDREKLAASELRRYLYLASDQLSNIRPDQDIAGLMEKQTIESNSIIVGKKSDAWISGLPESIQDPVNSLKGDDFFLKSYENSLLIIGGSSIAALYGAYHFIEHSLGVGFYLHGDVIPDKPVREVALTGYDQIHRPLFEIRGILPFHDFPEGPDWWDLEGLKAVLSRLPRLKMNFIGFHTYPQYPRYPGPSYQAEPMVWIGKKEDILEDGTVKKAYPALHFQTGHDTWGYRPVKTSDYSCGASMLFEEDHYGAGYMMHISGWPHTGEENVELFNQHGALLDTAFRMAGKLGIKTCIGTEVPLKIPSELLEKESRADDPSIEAYYHGIFERISRTHPLDYYWLWTGEDWTWRKIPDRDVDRVINDMQIAVNAMEKVNGGMQLATCGWVLGPGRDRAEFDHLLPREIPFSCINREVGWDYLEPAFNEISGRPKWAIPWMEDDPALISPQLWVGRMRKDAVDAFNYGCNGLIGIHWRTKNIAPSVSSLAKAAWKLGDWKNEAVEFPQRDLPSGDFYTGWARINFGEEVSEEVARIFSRLDGGNFYDTRQPHVRKANLYRASTWIRGPGGIFRSREPFDQVDQQFLFISDLEGLRPRVTGKGNLERFDYWLNTFRFERSMAHLGCVLGELDSIMAQLQTGRQPEADRSKLIEEAVELRTSSVRLYEEMMGYLLRTVGTTGEMGMITNLESHNRLNLELLSKHDSLIIELSGLNQDALPGVSTRYRGDTRIILPNSPSLLEADSDFRIKVIILSQEEILEAGLFWKHLENDEYQNIPLEHLARGVYRATLPANHFSRKDFEYYIRATTRDEKVLYPATAEETNLTVVVMSR